MIVASVYILILNIYTVLIYVGADKLFSELMRPKLYPYSHTSLWQMESNVEGSDY